MLENNAQQVKDDSELGAGSTFWGYISPANKTENRVQEWRIELSQPASGWEDQITNEAHQYQPFARGRSGEFKVKVFASVDGGPMRLLSSLPDSSPDVFCSLKCASMIGIVAQEGAPQANYWTVSNAFCDNHNDLVG